MMTTAVALLLLLLLLLLLTPSVRPSIRPSVFLVRSADAGEAPSHAP